MTRHKSRAPRYVLALDKAARRLRIPEVVLWQAVAAGRLRSWPGKDGRAMVSIADLADELDRGRRGGAA